MSFGDHRLSPGLRSGLAARKLLSSPESSRRNTRRGWRSYGCEVSQSYGSCACSKGVLEPRRSFREQPVPEQNAGRTNRPTAQSPVQSNISAGKMKILPVNGCLLDLYPFLPSLQYCQGQYSAGQNSRNKVTARLPRVPQICFPAFCATLHTNAECPNIFRHCSWAKFLAACTRPVTARAANS